MSTVTNEFNNLLEQISSTTPILFFPLRIETHFRKRNSDELCVRIFPDEIFFDYLTETLTEKEINDAKTFWVQWYIAGGSPKREYEAWQVLCTKYFVTRAAWLVRQLKPENIAHFRENGEQFNLRPFTKMPDIEKNINSIYSDLSSTGFNLDGVGLGKHGEIKDVVFAKLIKPVLNIESIVESYSEIVDYLYDDIEQAAKYIGRCLRSILSLNSKGSSSLSLPDDEIIADINNAVESLMKNINGKRIALDKLIENYLEKPPGEFYFPDIEKNFSGKPDIPVSNILPDRFMFIGEAKGRTEKIIHFGNKVKENLPMGINPNEDTKKNIYTINSEGDLEVDGGIDWMIDYDKAEAAGMAITVPIDSSIDEFNYVYVLGIKNADSEDEKYLLNLFCSHNYNSSGIAMLKTASPTNIVDGMEPAYDPDPEVEMKIRYDIEVAGASDTPEDKYDSMVLAKLLNLDYGKCFGSVENFDNQELHNAKEAYKILWDYFFNVLTDNKTSGGNSQDFLNQIGEFLVQYVRARGQYPAFRIENKPYSILPTGDLKKLSGSATQECPNYLIKGLIELAYKWKKVRKHLVVNSENLADANNKDTAAKRFLEMAGQTPYSTTFYERTLLNSPLLPHDNWYPNAMKEHFDLMHRYGFFDPWPIGGSEEEISFGNEKVQLSKVLNHLKEKLPALSEEELKQLVAEFYDIFTHRLDAWISGVFENIREKNCNKTPKIGAYGWVFNLKRATRKEIDIKDKIKIKEMALLSDEVLNTQKIYQNDLGEGYIVAPSVQHAVTAAVLRAAYLKTQKNKEDSHLCINLSSMRTRQALRMIDGIKQGMSTSVVLGADLERYLHEAYKTDPECEMDKYIYPLRKIFPQVISLQAEDERAHDYAMQVINGEALLNTFVEEWANDGSVSSWLNRKYDENNSKSEEAQDDCIKWFFILNKETNISEKHRNCLFKLIERVVDSYDALNDLLLAEGVHRLVMGDTASYSAINNFMAEGKGNLPEPAILDTPMEYVVVSNKTGVALPECKTPPKKPMCIAEPSISLWVEQLTGNLDNIIFYIETTTGTGEDEKTNFDTCSLKELDITPVEYLYLSSNENIFNKYLETRWRLKHNRFTEKVKIHAGKPDEYTEDIIFFNDKGETISDFFTLYEDELRISKLRSIVMQSAAMKANDLVPPVYGDYDVDMTIDIDDMKSRYASLRDYLAQLNANMESLINKLDNSDLDKDFDTDAYSDATLAAIYEHLCLCTTSGILSSLPEFNIDMFVYNIQAGNKHYHLNPIIHALNINKAVEKQQSFIEKYKYVYTELGERISEAEKIVKREGGETYSPEQYVEAIKKLLLANFKVCPRFTLHHALPQDIRIAFDRVIENGIGSYKNLNALSFEEWQFDVAEVRELMKTWHHLSLFQNISNGNTGKVAILQTNSEGMPVEELWLACKVEKEADLQDVDSLVIYNSEAFAKLENAKPVFNSGFIIDAWNEFIPYMKQTAGMVFHCDQPDNEAPQALLLAINSKYATPEEIWQLDDVLELLDFTRFMLMNRAVEPDHIYKDKQLSRLFPLLSNKVLTNDYINS